MTKSVVLLLGASFVLILSAAFSTHIENPMRSDSTYARLDQRVYVGVSKCKTCHKKVTAGEQYKIWSESAHAKAYTRLASDEAKAIAEEKGIADPQKAPECLECHVTAYGVDAEFLGPKYSIEDGVGCESCHGPGKDYYKKKTMTGVLAGDIDPESVGLILPDETVCLACHNDRSPSFKEFNFEDRKAEIAHPIPEDTKAKYLEG